MKVGNSLVSQKKQKKKNNNKVAYFTKFFFVYMLQLNAALSVNIRIIERPFPYFFLIIFRLTKEKEVREDGPVPPSTDSFAPDNSHIDAKPTVSEQVNSSDAEKNTQGGVQVISFFILRMFTFPQSCEFGVSEF